MRLDWCARLLHCWSWHGPCAGRHRSMYKFQLHTWMIIFPITSEGGFWDVQHLPAAPWPSHQRWCSSSTEVAKQPLCSQVLTLTKGGSEESNFFARWKSQHVEAFAAGKRCVHYTGVLLWSFEIKYWLNCNTYLFLQCVQCRLYTCDLWGIFSGRIYLLKVVSRQYYGQIPLTWSEVISLRCILIVLVKLSSWAQYEVAG